MSNQQVLHPAVPTATPVAQAALAPRVGNLLHYDELSYAAGADPVKCELCGVWLYTPKTAEVTFRQCWTCHTAAHGYALKALTDATDAYMEKRLSRFANPLRLNRAALRKIRLDAHYAVKGVYERAMGEYKTLVQTGQLAEVAL